MKPLMLHVAATQIVRFLQRAKKGMRQSLNSSDGIASKTSILIRVVCGVLLLVLFAELNLTLIVQLDVSSQKKIQVASKYRNIKSLTRLLDGLREAESAQRGYLLTGDNQELVSFREGVARVTEAQAYLARNFEEIHVNGLDVLTTKRLGDLIRIQDLQKTGHVVEARKVVRTRAGRDAMWQIDVQIRQLVARLTTDIVKENKAYRQAFAFVRYTILASYGLVILFFVGDALFFHREVRARALIEQKLRQHEAELQLRIAERTAELTISESRYRAMLDQSPLAIHILDLAGNSRKINTAFERMVGVSAAQMEGYNIWSDPQPAAQGTLDCLRRAFAGDLAMTGAVRHVPELSVGTALAEGAKPVWAEVIAYPVKDSAGIVQEVVLLCQDVTEREDAVRLVRESELQFRQLANVVPQFVWSANPKGQVDYFNERWYAFCEIPSDPREDWQPFVHPDDLVTSLELWKTSIREEVPFQVEQRLWDTRQQEYRWHLARAVPIFDREGELKRWVGTTTDIQEQKAAEQQLEQRVSERTAELQRSYQLLKAQGDQLRQSLTEREILFREVYHRVKNNLQLVSSLLRMQSEILKTLPAAAVALEESRRRVLSMSLIHERLYNDGSVEDLDFGQYASALVRDLVYSYALPGRRVVYRSHVQPIRLDLQQAIPCGLILNELITNALKYAFVDRSSGEIRILLSKVDSNSVSLSVIDDGIGLPEGLDWKSSPSLGLPIVNILAKQLDGTVEYCGAGGTSFTVTFPIAQSK